MTFGFSSETVYEATELRKPGWNSSVTAAPPTTCRRSSTVTFKPVAARYAAQTKPLWPPPTIRTSDFAGTAALRNHFMHATGKTAQTHFALAQRPDAIAARAHACLHA